jgi:glutamyl/glutaminyl-tRNA synthetase
MADIDKEVFDNGEPVVTKVKKTRKPMSASKKAAFAARMKASREAKKAAKVKPVDELKEKLLPKEQPVAEPVEKIKKPRRNIRHVPDELDSHLVIINSLKADIAEMKLHQSSKKDLEEIKQLKSELKAIRAQKKKEQKTKDIVVKVKEEVKQEFVKEEPVQPVPTPLPSVPIDIPKPRYSTYKKSIWSKLL